MPWHNPVLLNVLGMILLGMPLELCPVVHRMKQFKKLVAGELEGEVMHERVWVSVSLAKLSGEGKDWRISGLIFSSCLLLPSAGV